MQTERAQAALIQSALSIGALARAAPAVPPPLLPRTDAVPPTPRVIALDHALKPASSMGQSRVLGRGGGGASTGTITPQLNARAPLVLQGPVDCDSAPHHLIAVCCSAVLRPLHRRCRVAPRSHRCTLHGYGCCGRGWRPRLRRSWLHLRRLQHARWPPDPLVGALNTSHAREGAAVPQIQQQGLGLIKRGAGNDAVHQRGLKALGGRGKSGGLDSAAVKGVPARSPPGNGHTSNGMFSGCLCRSLRAMP